MVAVADVKFATLAKKFVDEALIKFVLVTNKFVPVALIHKRSVELMVPAFNMVA